MTAATLEAQSAGRIREAIAAALALEDAARSFRTHYPAVAAELERRAQRIRAAATERERRSLRSLAAAGRWVARDYKSGPHVSQGPGHITVDRPGLITDVKQRALCGTSVIGRNLHWGPRVVDPADPPPGWRVCAGCAAAFRSTSAAAR
jgi:hypothetical protein